MSDDEARIDVGGDAACWLSKLCPECGAMLESPDECWRCRARFDADGAVVSADGS